MKKLIILFIISIFAVSLLSATEVVGEIAFLEGDVSITRDGETIEGYDLDFGSVIENYDLIETGNDGTCIIATYPETGVDAELRVDRSSVFYLEISGVEQESHTTVELMTGAIHSSVERLTGRNTFSVQTESAAMGVRGTSFEVASSTTGDILVTCEEGSVECENNNGDILFAEPGRAVEQSAERFRQIPVAVSDIETFRENWITEQSEALRANALRAIRNYSRRYDRYFDQFAEAWADLQSESDVIIRWIRQDREGEISGSTQLLREKRALIGPLMDIRRSLFMFERIYYRVLELQEYHEQGYGRGNIRRGYSTAHFFNRVENERSLLEDRMARYRYILKLFAIRNDGRTIFESFSSSGPDEGFTDEDDFFSDDNSSF
ncbi:MAG: FecR domain-containing protein [Spirochaetia bacterium]